MPAFRLSKQQAAELDQLVARYEEAKADLSEFLTNLVADWDEAWNGRSEKWQEGDAGQAVRERIDAVQSLVDDEMPSEGEPVINIEELSEAVGS